MAVLRKGVADVEEADFSNEASLLLNPSAVPSPRLEG
jgi:hypothetical protein